MSHPDCLRAALAYAKRGWPVVALHTPDEAGACSCRAGRECDSPGKHPRYDRELLPSGLQSATTDPDVIRCWWQRWPTANVGILTGDRSGLYVLDADPKSGGFDSLARLEAGHGQLPLTLRVETGSGGSHDYFARPAEGTWPNTAGKLGAGLDTRGDGGYIVAPPSLHASGRRYSWSISPEEAALAQLPPWLADRVRPEERATGGGGQPGSSSGGNRSAAIDAFGRKALAEELATLAGTREGGRNDALNLAAFNLGQLVGADALDEGQVVAALEGVALSIGLGVRETRATVVSGLNDGKARPRDLGHVGQPKHPPTASALVEDAAAHRPIDQDEAMITLPTGLLACTDYGNAQRLVARHGQDLRYVEEWGWLVWNGRHWERDTTGEVERRAKSTAQRIAEEVRPDMGEKAVEILLKWARSSGSRARLESMIALARSEPGIPVRSNAFDRDDWLVSCENGTIDLRTGDLRSHDREDLITKCLASHYDPTATCPTWLRFLGEIMGDQRESMVPFLQRTIGYSLTGSSREQVMFMLYGTGANGKSTFLEVLRSLLGEYGRQTDPSTFLARPNQGIPNDIARLVGCRFVSAIEVDEGRRLSEALLKQIVAGDTLTARFLNKEFFEFQAKFKLFLATNHKPPVRGTDDGIWRRIRMVPFTVTIPPEQRDRTLLGRLLAELPGVLAWAVQGCLDYQRDGLAEPAEVRAATDAYRIEMDIVGAFLDEACVIAPGARANCDALYAAYHEWCDDNGEWCMSQRRFATQIEERGFERKRGSQGKWYRAGIGLRALTEGDDDGGDDPPGSPSGGSSGDVSGAPVTQVIQGDPTWRGRSMYTTDTWTDPSMLDHLGSLRSPEAENQGDSPPSGSPVRVVPRQGKAVPPLAGRKDGAPPPEECDPEHPWLWVLPDLPEGWRWVPTGSLALVRAEHVSGARTAMHDRSRGDIRADIWKEIRRRTHDQRNV